MRTLAVALLLVLAGCGGGSSDPPAKPTKTTAATSADQGNDQADGRPAERHPRAGGALEVPLRQGPQGKWNTSGYVANETKTKVTFQVTVYVGEAAGGEEKAKTRQVPNVAAGRPRGSSSTAFPQPTTVAPATCRCWPNADVRTAHDPPGRWP